MYIFKSFVIFFDLIINISFENAYFQVQVIEVDKMLYTITVHKITKEITTQKLAQQLLAFT